MSELHTSPTNQSIKKFSDSTQPQNKIQPARVAAIPPAIVQRRLGGWPSVEVTVFWQRYTRKNYFEYWVN